MKLQLTLKEFMNVLFFTAKREPEMFYTSLKSDILHQVPEEDGQ